MHVWDCNGTGAQRFAWKGKQIVHVDSGKCLKVISKKPGTPVLWTCRRDDTDQHFHYNPETNTITWLGGEPGQCLGAETNDAGAPVMVGKKYCNRRFVMRRKIHYREVGPL